ncbi:hypothetical protein GCM10011512_28180 [Tersicoccus solisilvae]|uniref:Bacterial Ig domain-containing protein n=1 Tax=Tersicoccus solisilvae TaxID=1882339 RepID=A0ABQ1PMI4_9MICC|nr:hypothetical protein [Tersicoccus solisilvae]GGC99622.1 hypothetical protein GCM10011512_28180 [Tersicoccus solisilvae]
MSSSRPARRSLTSLAVAGAVALTGLVAAAPADAAPTVTTRVYSFAAGPATVTRGAAITVSGSVQKLSAGAWRASAGAPVAVYFDPAGSAPNALVRTVKAATNGGYSTRFTASVTGVWSVRSAVTASLKPSALSVRRTVTVVAPRPSSTRPVSAWNCPSWAPIKGNASSHIFHRPGQRFYTRTKPEICFTTPAAAIAAGYRASKV